MAPQEKKEPWVYIEIPGYGVYRVTPGTGILMRKALDTVEGNPERLDLIRRRFAEIAGKQERLLNPANRARPGSKDTDPWEGKGHPDDTLQDSLAEGVITQAEANRYRMDLERRTSELRKSSPELETQGPFARLVALQGGTPERAEVAPRTLASAAETAPVPADSAREETVQRPTQLSRQPVEQVALESESETVEPKRETIQEAKARLARLSQQPVEQVALANTAQSVEPQVSTTPVVPPSPAPVAPVAAPEPPVPVPAPVATADAPEPVSRETEREILTGVQEAPTATASTVEDFTPEERQLLTLADEAYGRGDEEQVKHFLSQIKTPPPYGGDPLDLQAYAAPPGQPTIAEAPEPPPGKRPTMQEVKQAIAGGYSGLPAGGVTDRAEVQRVAKVLRAENPNMTGIEAHKAAVGLITYGSVEAGTLPRETLGQQFGRGVTTGLLHPLSFFGAHAPEASALFRDRGGAGEIAGNFLGMTPAFIAASALASTGLGAFGLTAATMTPLSFHLSRSAIGGMLLGFGGTEQGDWKGLPLNMTKEAALWMTFDLGLLTLFGKTGRMFEQGRQIRGVRRQIRGTSRPEGFTVPPTYLDIERILNPNMAENVKEAANRIVASFRLDPKNPYAGAAVEFTKRSQRHGELLFDASSKEEAEALLKGLKDLKQEGIHYELHGDQKLLVLQPEYQPGLSERVSRDNLFWFLKSTDDSGKPITFRGDDGEISTEAIIDFVRKGLVEERGGVPPVVEVVQTTQRKGAKAFYEYAFGGKGRLGKRNIRLEVNPKASDKDILSAIAHEGMHDVLVMILGKNPQRMGLLKDLLGVTRSPFTRGGKSSYKGLRIRNTKKKVEGDWGMRIDIDKGVIYVNETQLKALYLKYRARRKAGGAFLGGTQPSQIKNYSQFRRFVLEHEYQHKALGRGVSEARVNAAARVQLNKEIGLEAAEKELRQATIEAIMKREKLDRKAATAFYKANPELHDDFEGLANLMELMVRNHKRARQVAPAMSRLLGEYVLETSPMLRMILNGEQLVNSNTASKLLDIAEAKIKAGLVKEGFEVTGTYNARWSKLGLRQPEYRRALIEQFKREGVFDGMSAWLKDGTRMEVIKRNLAGNIVIRNPTTRRVTTVKPENLRFATMQNVVKMDKDMVRLAKEIVDGGLPHILGIGLRDGKNVLRFTVRTSDLELIPQGKTVAQWIAEKRPDLDIAGKVDSELYRIAGAIAQEEGLAGLLVDEGLGARIIMGDIKNGSIHHSNIDVSAVRTQDIRSASYEISNEDIFVQHLYQSGIPLIESERLARLLATERLEQIWPNLGKEFTRGYDQTLAHWDDISKELEFLNVGRADDATRSGLLYEMLDDGTVILRDPMHRHVGKFKTQQEAEAYLAKLDPTTAPRNYVNVTGVLEGQTAGLGAVGGAGSPRPAATIDDLATKHTNLWSDNTIDELRRMTSSPQAFAEGALDKFPNRILGMKDKIFTLFTAMKPVAQAYEKEGFGPAYEMVYRPLQRAFSRVQKELADPRAAFGGKSFSDRIHDYRVSMLNVEAGRRSLITRLAFRPTPTKGAAPQVGEAGQTLIGVLEKRGLGDDLPQIFQQFINFQRYARQNEKYLLTLNAETRGMPTRQRQFNQAVLGMTDDEAKAYVAGTDMERTLKLAELAGVSPEVREVMLLLNHIVDPKNKIDINLLQVSRHFSNKNQVSRMEFIRANGMTAEEVKLSDELVEIVAESFPTGRAGAERFLQDVFPEAGRWVESGIELNEQMVKQFFGDDALFLHHKMTTASIGPYIKDPVTLAYRTVRGRLMEDFFDPVFENEAKHGLDAMANYAMGLQPGLQRAQAERAYRNMMNYTRELQGTPHNSFIMLNEKLSGLFDHMGMNVPPDVAQDFLQKMSQLTYKAFIPMRPLLLIRNLSEVVRLGGTVGGQDLGYGIRYVMKNPKKALEEAVAGGAIRHESPLFPVDNAAMMSRGGAVVGARGRAADKFLRASQKATNKINDVTEIGMGWYQSVDELTRAVAYHSMKQRVGRHMDLAQKDWGAFIKKSKISTFDETEIKAFTEMWAKDQKSAVDYIATMFSDNSLFLYGAANHPVGWQSAWGVLFGQFGTWPVQYAQWMLRGATRGSYADRAQFLAWNLGAMGGLVAVGSKVGLDLRSYWGMPSLPYMGGPYFDFGMDLITAMKGNEREAAMARASLKGSLSPLPQDWPTMFIPLSAAAADARDALFKYDGVAQGLFHEFVVPQARPTE